MKFMLPVLLILYVSQSVASKSWNNDKPPDETFFVFGWLGYLKRLALIAFMLSGVLLYYVPESRPHARRICLVLIDLTANGLKSVLGTQDEDRLYEKIKSKYHKARYEKLLTTQKYDSKTGQDDEDFENKGNKMKTLVDGDGLPVGAHGKKINAKESKEDRLYRHRLRGGNIKDRSNSESFAEIAKLENLQKYLKGTLSSTKRPSAASIEKYALLISGTPQQMAMLDEKYEKDNVVIVDDPYLRVDFKECSTSVDKLSSKVEVSGSEQEGPTRDYDDHTIESKTESCFNDMEVNTILDGDSRYSASKSPFRMNKQRCGGECCGNRCCVSSADLNNKRDIFPYSADMKNVLKSTRSMVTSKPLKKVDASVDSFHRSNNNNFIREEDRFAKISGLNNRTVSFQKEDKTDRIELPSNQKIDEDEHPCENTYRYLRRKKFRIDDPPSSYYPNTVSYCTDRGGEADDETSHHDERVVTRHDLDVKPQKENYLYVKDSDDSLLERELYPEPLMNNRVKPALVRAVNWIFGGCPRSSSTDKSVKEENRYGDPDEWLL